MASKTHFGHHPLNKPLKMLACVPSAGPTKPPTRLGTCPRATRRNLSACSRHRNVVAPRVVERYRFCKKPRRKPRERSVGFCAFAQEWEQNVSGKESPRLWFGYCFLADRIGRSVFRQGSHLRHG